jgi:hypothetical protein
MARVRGAEPVDSEVGAVETMGCKDARSGEQRVEEES